MINGIRTNVGLAIQFTRIGRPRAVNIETDSMESLEKIKEATRGLRRRTGKSQVSSLLTSGSFSMNNYSEDNPIRQEKKRNSDREYLALAQDPAKNEAKLHGMVANEARRNVYGKQEMNG